MSLELKHLYMTIWICEVITPLVLETTKDIRCVQYVKKYIYVCVYIEYTHIATIDSLERSIKRTEQNIQICLLLNATAALLHEYLSPYR